MRFLADTHSLLWYLQGDKRLSESSRRLFDEGGRAGQVVIPTIVLAELLHLYRKYEIPVPFEKTLGFLEKEERFEICPLSSEVIRKAISLTRFEIHDSLIVATALHLDIPLMTRDTEIKKSGAVRTFQP